MELSVRSLRKYESRDCDMFEMISSFCLQIMTGYITRCLFAAFVFMLWIYFLISSLPHYGLMKIKVVKKKRALYSSHMSLLRLYGNMLLISEKMENTKHRKTKATVLIWSLQCEQLGSVCCCFSLSV